MYFELLYTYLLVSNVLHGHNIIKVLVIVTCLVYLLSDLNRNFKIKGEHCVKYKCIKYQFQTTYHIRIIIIDTT